MRHASADTSAWKTLSATLAFTKFFQRCQVRMSAEHHTNDFCEILRPNALDLRLQQSMMLGVLPYPHCPVHPLSELCRETCCICNLPGCRQVTCSALIPFGNICTSKDHLVKATQLYVQARLCSNVSLGRKIIVPSCCALHVWLVVTFKISLDQ